MANKRTYTIEIAGVKEAFDNVSSLADVLDKLTDKAVNVTANVDKVTEATTKNSTATKESTSSADALSKAKQKLADFDAEYEKELQQVNSELSKNKKEIKELIQQQEAQSVVEEKQLNSYAEKQKYLTSLNKLIRTHANVTEEDKTEIQAMVEESARLQAELKEFDEQMKIYTRNVGNYPGAAQMVIDSNKSMKQELKELKNEMAEMIANGVDKTDPKFLALAQRAGELKDAMSDASDEISHFASDTAGIDNVINLATTATSVWGLYNSALTVFGEENEAVAESMQKMMAIMQMLQSLQALQNTLTANGSATAKIYTTVTNALASALGLKSKATEVDTATTQTNTAVNEANTVSEQTNAAANAANAAAKEADTVATETNTVAEGTNTAAEGANTTAKTANTAATGANTVAEGANTTAKTANATATGAATAAQGGLTLAQKAGAIASKALGVAMRSIPLIFIIGLVIDLVTHWKEIWKWLNDTFPVIGKVTSAFKGMGGFMNTLKAICVGFGKAVVNWVINPLRTLGKVMASLFKGDFEGAWNAMKEGLKQQYAGTVEAFKSGFKSQVEKGLEDMRLKATEEANKTTQQELKELKIRERNNKTYSDKHIALQKKDFAERKKLAKGNKEELNKIKLEEMQFDADVEDKKTAYAKEQQQERTKAAKAGAAERTKTAKAAQAEANKAADEYKKRIQELYKAVEQTIQKSDNLVKQGIQLQRKTYEEYFKTLISTYEEMYGKTLKGLINGESFYTNEMLSANVDAVQDYAFKRKMIVYQTLAEEADETRNTYRKILNEITSLIQKTSSEAEKASGETKVKLEAQLTSLQLTYKNVKKSMEDLLGDYAGNADFQIPLSFDTDAIIKRFKDIVPKLSADVQKLFESHKGLGAITDFLENTGNQFEYLLTTASKVGQESTFKEYLISIAEILNGDTKEVQDLKNGLQNVFTVVDEEGNGTLQILGELPDSFVATKKAMQENGDVLAGLIEDFRNLSVGSNIAVDRLNILGADTRKKWKEISEEVSKGLKKAQDDSLKEIISTSDKLISYNDKVIKKFQEATKGLKLEPVKVDDAFTKTFDGQIMSIDKTRERYEKLRKAYEEYQETIRVNMGRDAFEKEWHKIIDETIKKYGEGSKEWAAAMNKHQSESIERNKAEDLWQKKLYATKILYGKDSVEYKLMLDEKTKADAQYAMEYEKTQQSIQDIDKKTNSIFSDYAESLGKRIQDIYKAFSENMFEPLAEGFTALLDYQIEEAEKRLEDIEELLDKAVELREDSEERIEEINDKLKDSDVANKEALKQQLADEQVLLVQRQQTERDLNKQKEREEALIKKKEKQQRKIELGQKLIEGIVNTAVGVTAALKYGPILGPIFAAIIGAMGALQTGIIIKQMSKLEKGGLLKGKSHKQGGMRVEGTNIEVEGGEFVVNKKSTTKYINLIEAINEDNPFKVRRLSNRYDMGGRIGKPTTIINNYNNTPLVSSSIRKYASGGRLDYGGSVAAIEQNTTTNRITEAMSHINFNPVVSVVDIQKKTKSLTKVRDLAGK